MYNWFQKSNFRETKIVIISEGKFMALSGNEMMWQALAKLDLTMLEASTENGADPNFKQNGLTPVEYLLINNDQESPRLLEMFNLLIGSGADLNLRKMFSKQPLYLAVEKNLKQTVEMFLKFNADKDRKFSVLGQIGVAIGLGLTPLQAAEKCGYREIIELLK